MERTTVRRTVDLDCSAADLWRLVTAPDELNGWLGRDVDLDLRPGGAGRLVDDGVLRRLVVDDVVDGERLAFTWWPDGDEGATTEVVFAVEETDGGSRLTITESADDQLAAGSWDARVVSLWLAVCTQARV